MQTVSKWMVLMALFMIPGMAAAEMSAPEGNNTVSAMAEQPSDGIAGEPVQSHDGVLAEPEQTGAEAGALPVDTAVGDAEKKPEADTVVRLTPLTIKGSPIVDKTAISVFGSAVTLVTSDQIDALNAQDLTTALVKVPGMTMSRHNIIGAYGGGEGGAVYMRGNGATRPGQDTSACMDGISKYSGIWYHSLVDMLPIDSAGQVEVYKSSQPVLFGNMSSGVVNMVPKKMTEDGQMTRILALFGSHQTWANRLETGWKKDGVDAYFEGHSKVSDGHRENAGGRVNGFYTRLGYEIDAHWNASVQVHHTDSSVDDPGVEGSAAPALTENFATESNMEIVTVAHHDALCEGTVKFYRDQGLQDWRQWSGSESAPFYSVSNFVNYGLKLQEKLKLIEKSELLVGLDHEFTGGRYAEEHTTDNLYEQEIYFRNTAPYLLGAYTVGGTWNITPSAGIRYNISEYFDDQIGWQAGVKLRQEAWDLTLYGNVAKGFNLPGIYSTIVFNQDWKELTAEQTLHREVGLTHQVISNLRYHVAYFRDDVADALDVVFPPPHYANVGWYTSSGVNAEIQAAPLPGLECYVGGTWTQLDVETVAYLPAWTVTTGVQYTWAGYVTLGAHFQAMDDYYAGNPRSPAKPVLIEAYELLNLRLSTPLATWIPRGPEGEWFMAVENALNKDYALKPGYPMPKAVVMTGLDIRL